VHTDEGVSIHDVPAQQLRRLPVTTNRAGVVTLDAALEATAPPTAMRAQTTNAQPVPQAVARPHAPNDATDGDAQPEIRPGLRRIAVRSLNRIVIVPVAQIVRLEADDNYVRIWADRMYLHKETLTRLVANLDPTRFQRVHRSHAINLESVRELRPLLHGEYRIVMIDGTEITSGRSYTRALRQAFELE
jgi:DNA-binding LytR/AlgR family response regulator